MAKILWREGWIKPLLTESLPSERCSMCNKEFKDLMDFKMKNGNNKDEDIELIKITVANN